MDSIVPGQVGQKVRPLVLHSGCRAIRSFVLGQVGQKVRPLVLKVRPLVLDSIIVSLSRFLYHSFYEEHGVA